MGPTWQRCVMSGSVRNWLWGRLRGTVDELGNRRPAADDPVVIFAGVPEQ